MISITMFMVCVNVYYVYLLEVCIICTSLHQQTSPVWKKSLMIQREVIKIRKCLMIQRGVIKIRKSNGRQHNGQKKTNKCTNNDLQKLHRKLTIEQHEPYLKQGVSSDAQDG